MISTAVLIINSSVWALFHGSGLIRFTTLANSHRELFRLRDVQQLKERTMAQAKAKFASGNTDAISILIEDHEIVKKMFTDFAQIMKFDDKAEGKVALVEKICEELTVHSQIEEEIFYPAVLEAFGENDLMSKAEVEHADAKELIGQLQEMEPGDDQYDAFVTLLGENVDHHVKEEQEKMFPQVKESKLNLDVLGAQMLERKQELQANVLTTA